MRIKSALTKMGLVEEDVVVTPKAKVTTTVTQQPASSFTPAPSFNPSPAATVDPEFADLLNKSIQASKLAFFDYLKFISVVEKAKSTGVAEDARFKMAFSTAQEMDVDKEKLLKSGDHYLQVLSEDESDFTADCATFEKDEVTARQTQLSAIETSITDLSKKLADLQQQHQTIETELAEKTASLESRKASFQATLQSFRSTIETNIKKINQYLQ